MQQATTTERSGTALKAVIFDWAGTVVDFGSLAPVRAVMEVFRTADVPITADEARGPMGKSKRDHLCALLQLPRIAVQWQAAHGTPWTEDDVDRLYASFLPRQKQLLEAHSGLIPGCQPAIAELRAQGLRIGSTTGYTRELMDILAPLAARQGFEPEAIVTASDVAVGRPAPWMCFECARRMDVFPPASIVVVDDTTVGVEAGRNAGMWSVGVVQSGNLMGLGFDEFAQITPQEKAARSAEVRSRLQSAGAHYLVDTVADLLPVISQIADQLSCDRRP